MRRPSFFCLLVEILLVLPSGSLDPARMHDARGTGPELLAQADTHISPDRMENLPDLLQRIVTSGGVEGSGTCGED